MSLVNINPNQIVRNNTLKLGCHPDHARWTDLRNATVRQYLMEANIKLVRFFDFRTASPRITPCTSWNSTTHSGAFNWTNADEALSLVESMGAEALFCLAHAGSVPVTPYLPPGMTVDATTLLPTPDDFAAYCAQWIYHYGNRVKYYELWNEPGTYFFPNNTFDVARFGYFMDVWEASSALMRQLKPDVSLSCDNFNRREVFTNWLNPTTYNGPAWDRVDFHKYDLAIDTTTIETAFSRAEGNQYDGTTFSAIDARDLYLANRGKTLPMWDTESNMDSQWSPNTDVRMFQITGGAWLAMALKGAIDFGVAYHVYFEPTGPYNSTTGTFGFGLMSNSSTPPTRLIPYYVYKMFGANISVGDPIVYSLPADTNLRSIAWKHGTMLNIVLVNKSQNNIQASLSGVVGDFAYAKLDGATNYLNPILQTGVYPSSNIPLNGYTVVLLQQTQESVKYLFSHWQDGDRNPTKTVSL